MRFVAIDFETANASQSSVCALGAVVVDDGKIVEARSWLVRPDPLVFDRINIMLHGIRPDDVKNEPTFDWLWENVFQAFFQMGPMLAHNARFDFSVLRRVLSQYHIVYPSLSYYCTRVISKRAWPGLYSYSLATVAEHLGIAFQHHDPMEDATAAARIAILASEKTGATDLHHLAELLAFNAGQFFDSGYRPCGDLGVGMRLKDLTATTTDFDCNHPFYDKLVVFTGALDSMTRAEAAQLVVNCGGRCTDGISRSVNYLVLGEQDFHMLRGEEKSSKMRKAEGLLAQGADIEMIPESDFLQMLGY